MRKAILHFGQSNAMGYSSREFLRNPVPAWSRTIEHNTAEPVVSQDTGAAFAYPTLANFPCLYNEQISGLLSNVVDAWGPYQGCNPPFGFKPNQQGSFGPELSASWLYKNDHPLDTMAIVKCVLGGSQMAEWIPGGSKWPLLSTMVNQATARLNASGETWEWEYVAVGHGESGAHSGNVTSTLYRDQCLQLFAALRAIMRPDLKFIVRRISDTWLDDRAIDYSITSVPGRVVTQTLRDSFRASAVWRRQIQDSLASEPGVYVYSSDGLEIREPSIDVTGYHHSPRAVLADGERQYACFRDAVPPPPPVPLVVRFNGSPVDWTVSLNGSPIGGNGDVIDVEEI